MPSVGGPWRNQELSEKNVQNLLYHVYFNLLYLFPKWRIITVAKNDCIGIIQTHNVNNLIYILQHTLSLLQGSQSNKYPLININII